MIAFEKWHGIGNDFLIVDEADAGDTFDSADAVRAVCNRNFGVGADGILVLGDATDGASDARMIIHNADGSRAEMCGNGIRVAARWLVESGRVAPGGDGSFAIQTEGGVMRPTVLDDGRVRVDMGDVTDHGDVTIDLASVDGELAGRLLTGRVLNVGNPHFAIHRAPTTRDVHTIGPAAEHHPHFPNRTNVEFWEVDDASSSTVAMRVWERGVGETLACGTGACAVARAAMAEADLSAPVTVRLPGGTLEIAFDGDRALMTGRAHRAWAGQLDVATLMAGLPAVH